MCSVQGTYNVQYYNRNKITKVGELLVEDTQPGPAAHVKAVEEVRDPLDAAGDQLNVFPVHPISLENGAVSN